MMKVGPTHMAPKGPESEALRLSLCSTVKHQLGGKIQNMPPDSRIHRKSYRHKTILLYFNIQRSLLSE